MATNESCDVVAAEVIRNILWPDYFTTLEKLACQGVCNTWREVLRHLPLAQELCIRFDKGVNVICIRAFQRATTILVGQAEGELSSKHFKACCEWLSISAERVGRI